MASRAKTKQTKPSGNGQWKSAPWQPAPKGNGHLPNPKVLEAPRPEAFAPGQGSPLQEKFPMQKPEGPLASSHVQRATVVALGGALLLGIAATLIFTSVELGTDWVEGGSIHPQSQIHSTYCWMMRFNRFWGRDISDYEAASQCF